MPQTPGIYAKWDTVVGEIVEGPKYLKGKMLDYDETELNALKWYRVLDPVYDRSDYDPHAHEVTSEVYALGTDGTYGVITRTITTAFKSLALIQSHVTAELTSFRDSYLEQGFIWGGALFDGDETARVNWSATVTGTHVYTWMNAVAYSTLALDTTPRQWTTKSNTTALFTSAELLQCGLAFMNWASACYTYCRSVKDDVLAASTASDAWYIWTANDEADWPDNDLGGTFSLTQP